MVSAEFQIDATPPLFGACALAGPFLLHSDEHAVSAICVDAAISGLDPAASPLSGSVETDSIGPKTLTFKAV